MRRLGGAATARRARSLLIARRWREAEEVLDRALAKRPAQVELWALRARARLGAGEEAGALADAAEAARWNFGALWAMAGETAESLFARGEVERALMGLEALLAANPDRVWALTLKADALSSPRLGRHSDSLTAAERAAEQAPGAFWAQGCLGRMLEAAAKPREALAAFDRALAVEPECLWALLARARLRASLGEFRGAERDAREACRLDPKALEPRLGLAAALAKTGRSGEALSMTAACLAQARRAGFGAVAQVRALRFEILRGMGDLKRAAAELAAAAALGGRRTWAPETQSDARALAPYVEELNAAVRARGKNGWLRAWRGEIRLRMGALGPAVEDLLASIYFDHENPWAWIWLGKARLACGEPAQTVRDINRALRLAEPAEALLVRGQGFRRLRRFARAVEDFTRALEADPSSARAYLCRAEALLRWGRPGSLEEDVRRALELNPSYADALRLRAELRESRGDLGGAMQDLDQAIALRPGSAVVWLQRALLQGKKGDAKAQLRDFQSALRAQPEFFHHALPGLFGEARRALREDAVRLLLERALETPN